MSKKSRQSSRKGSIKLDNPRYKTPLQSCKKVLIFFQKRERKWNKLKNETKISLSSLSRIAQESMGRKKHATCSNISVIVQTFFRSVWILSLSGEKMWSSRMKWQNRCNWHSSEKSKSYFWRRFNGCEWKENDAVIIRIIKVLSTEFYKVPTLIIWLIKYLRVL